MPTNTPNDNEQNPPDHGGVPPAPPKGKKAKSNGADATSPKAADPMPEDGGDTDFTPDVGDDYQPIDAKTGTGPNGETTPEDLDEDEAEFARLRRDLPHVEGAAALGIQAIAVVKAPPKNTFFRAHKVFRPIVDLVVDQVRLDQKYYAVDPAHGPGADLDRHRLRPAHALPDHHANGRFSRHSGSLRLMRTASQRVRRDQGTRPSSVGRRLAAYLYRPRKLHATACFPRRRTGSRSRYGRSSRRRRSFAFAFRDRGYLIDTPEHPRFIDWVGRKPKDDGQ